MAAHTMEERDGILIIRFVGKVDPENAKAFTEMSIPKIRVPGQKKKVIADFRMATDYTPAGMNVIAKYSHDNAPYIEKSAVIVKPEHEKFMKFGIKLARRTDIGVFTSEEEAMKWLKEG